MLKVGVTGGIGSGKTTVCRIFETLGIPVYYADDRAKWLMAHDPELKAAITGLFGAGAYSPEGALNRKYIANIVFRNSEKLEALNGLVHPAVFADGERWNEAQQQKGAPYTIKEAALIFESDSHQALDKVITVTAPEALRIERVMERDGADREAIRARMARQLPEVEKAARSDYVIINDGRHSLIQQVLKIHRELTHA